jgi:hypothetical protein
MLDLNFALAIVCLTAIALTAIAHKEVDLARSVIDGLLDLVRDAIKFIEQPKSND